MRRLKGGKIFKMKRRLFIIILAALLAFTGIPILNISALGLQDDIEVHYRTTASSINRGDIFTLTIILENISDVSDDSKFSNIIFDIQTNSNFTVLGGQSSVSNAKFGDEYSINLQYEGGSNNVPIRISYTKDGTAVAATYANITISEIDESSSSSSGSYSNEPKLLIAGTSIPEAASGDAMKISLTITNESKYTARNIIIKLTPEDSDSSPFDMNSLSLSKSISSLNAGKSEGVIFDLKVKPYAEEKTYVMNVEFKYDNSRNNSFTSNEKIYVKVTGNKTEPVLMLGDIKYSANPVKAGAKFQVSIDVSNVGDLDAEGIRLSVEGLKKEEFTLSSGVDSWYFDKIEGNDKKNIILSLLAADSMGSGNYGLSIKMDYKDQRKNSYTNNASFFVNVQGEAKSSNVSLNNIVVMPQEVKTNENFMLSFDVYNEGKTAARNVKVTVKGDEGIISKSPDVRIIENLAAGEQKKLEYILYANSEAKTQNYNILLNLEYEDAEKEGSKHSVAQYAGIYVNGGNSKITPKIIISNYNLEPKLVRAGEEFNMDLTFMNTSMTKEVKNVKIYLTGIDSDKEGNVVFTPVGSSNTFFVDSIKPKGNAARSITMYTIPDAQPKYYNITANIEYQDDEGTEYKAAELIGIPVIQQSKLDASEISLPPEVYIGQPSPISLQYYNKGKTKLTNLMIKIEGDFQLENGEAFIGNFESGSSDYYEAMLTPTKPGSANGKVVFSFEDPSGEEFKYEREFTVNVVEMPPMEMPGEMLPEPVSTKDKIMNNTIKNKYFWIGIAVIAAGVFTSRKLIKNKRRKDMDLDE
ncbi:MAG: hypothetical protein APF77_11825 [Clostridia bacterium BRH_c25]|nr:MAG: hypothetical protein APF77_11825 [Clostridia bacterium BRH_c25]